MACFTWRATYEGETVTRNSKHPYRFAAVVLWPGADKPVITKFSRTESGARNCLTKQQRENGAKVITVVPVEEVQPDLSALSTSLGRLVRWPAESKKEE